MQAWRTNKHNWETEEEGEAFGLGDSRSGRLRKYPTYGSDETTRRSPLQQHYGRRAACEQASSRQQAGRERQATNLRLDLQLDRLDKLLVKRQQCRRAPLVAPHPLETLIHPHPFAICLVHVGGLEFDTRARRRELGSKRLKKP